MQSGHTLIIVTAVDEDRIYAVVREGLCSFQRRGSQKQCPPAAKIKSTSRAITLLPTLLNKLAPPVPEGVVQSRCMMERCIWMQFCIKVARKRTISTHIRIYTDELHEITMLLVTA